MLAERAGRNRHAYPHRMIVAVLDMRIDHPGHKFRVTLDVCDEVE